MAGKKIKIIKPKFKIVKKPSLVEIKAEQEKKEEEEAKEEEQEEFDFEADTESERKAPVLAREEAGEELESRLEGVETEEKEHVDEFKYELEKPKYSISEEREEEIENVRRAAMEKPSLIERTHEAREIESLKIQDSMLEHAAEEEYKPRHATAHKQDILEESEEIKGRKVDIKKYKRER